MNELRINGRPVKPSPELAKQCAHGTPLTPEDIDRGIDKMTNDTLHQISRECSHSFETIKAVYDKVNSFYFVWIAIQAADEMNIDILKAADFVKQLLLNEK
jgi:hypothetical protein